MRTPIIVGNWKMNLLSEEAVELADAVSDIATRYEGRVDVGIAPPSIWLDRVTKVVGNRPVRVYGQNISTKPSGAVTGEVSAPMLADAGLDGALVGHSERRGIFGETDQDTAEKLRQLEGNALVRILCVGETLSEREAGDTWEVVRRQLEGAQLTEPRLDDLVIAYEPVWAIGTGKTATPAQAQDVHNRIRTWLARAFSDEAAAAMRIQYGGSVKPGNASELLAMADIDGALVGGASLSAEAFAAIVEASVR